MADEPHAEEQEHEVPAEHVGDRAFQRVGPGGVLDHTAMMGTLDTTDTGSVYGINALERLAPIFKVARAYDMAVAARALDPEDEEVREDQVQVSQGFTVVQGDPEADRKRVRENARKAQTRLDGEETEFDPKFSAHFDRQAEAERAWVVSMENMQPGIVVGGRTLKESTSHEDPEADESSTEDPPNDETPSTLENEGLTGVDPKIDPALQAKLQDRDYQQGSFSAEWEEASRRVRETVEEGLKQSNEPSEPAPPAPVEEARTSVKPPNKASSKSAWVEWALYCDPTLTREKAEAMRREDLIDQYDKYRENK